MKATLEFTLPEETDEHRHALEGSRWQNVVWELDQWLRSKEKHEGVHTVTVEEARNKIYEIINDDGLVLP